MKSDFILNGRCTASVPLNYMHLLVVSKHNVSIFVEALDIVVGSCIALAKTLLRLTLCNNIVADLQFSSVDDSVAVQHIPFVCQVEQPFWTDADPN